MDFIVALQFRQCRLEVSLGHLVGSRCQLLQWVDISFDGAATEDVDYQHAYQDERDGDARNGVAEDVEIELGYYDGDGPVGVFDHLGAEEDFLIIDLNLVFPAVVDGQVSVMVVRVFFYIRLNVLPDETLCVRVHQQGARAVGHVVVNLIGRIPFLGVVHMN